MTAHSCFMNAKIKSHKFLIGLGWFNRIFLFVGISAVTGLVLAQGLVTKKSHPQYDPKSQPPMTLSEAYKLAMAHVGPATNRLWCVSADLLAETKTSSSITHWTFRFSDTNGGFTKVLVFFDKDVFHLVGAVLHGDQMK